MVTFFGKQVHGYAVEIGVGAMGHPVAGIDIAAAGGQCQVGGPVAMSEDKIIERLPCQDPHGALQR